MTQPNMNQVHINRPLTNISVAFMQDQTEFVADKIFPRVPVAFRSNSYFKYDADAFARAIAQYRAGASESFGGGWGHSTDTYNCAQQSLHHDVPADVAANTDAPLDPFRDAVEWVTRGMLIKREVDFQTAYFKTGVWGTDNTLSGTQQWSDYTNSDPYTDFQNAIRVVQKACLVKPNVALMGPEVFDALKNHPDLKDRYKYTTSDSLTVDMLSRTLGVQIVVGEAVKITSVEGQTNTSGFVFGKKCLLAYAAPRPSLLMPSAGYIFSWSAFDNNFGARIDRFPMRHLNNAQRVEGDMAYDTKVVSTAAGYFFETAVA